MTDHEDARISDRFWKEPPDEFQLAEGRPAKVVHVVEVLDEVLPSQHGVEAELAAAKQRIAELESWNQKVFADLCLIVRECGGAGDETRGHAIDRTTFISAAVRKLKKQIAEAREQLAGTVGPRVQGHT